MKYLWCVNQLPDYAKGDKVGIDGYFLGAFDPVTTKAALQGIANRGKARGVYMASNWPQFEGMTPAQVADVMDARYRELFVSGLRVQFDMEQHVPDEIVATLTRWRQLRPTVGTSLTVEGMQGGWLGQISRVLIDLKVRVVPQAYWGSGGTIQGRWPEDKVLRDLTRAGFPEALVTLFYDAADLPREFDGYAFEQNRLPQ